MIIGPLYRELVGLLGSDDLSEAFQAAGLLEPHEKVSDVRTITDWHRSGSESFLLVFSLHSSLGAIVPLVLKAYATFLPAEGLSIAFKRIIDRRQLLANHGVAVPALYAAGKATVLEQFIPYSLTEWIQSAEARDRQSMLLELHALAETLDSLRFSPISVYSDLRTDGRRPYLVDFGEDLGPPGLEQDGSHNNVTQLTNWIAAIDRLTVPSTFSEP